GRARHVLTTAERRRRRRADRACAERRVGIGARAGSRRGHERVDRRGAAERGRHSRDLLRSWRHGTRARERGMGGHERDRARDARADAARTDLEWIEEQSMTQLTTKQYDELERAVVKGTRIVVYRRGRREYVVVPLALRLRDGRELIEARNPTTGHDLSIYLD